MHDRNSSTAQSNSLLSSLVAYNTSRIIRAESIVSVALIVTLAVLCGKYLEGHVVTVLLRVEHPPAVTEGSRILVAQDAIDGRIAVRDMDARSLVVAVVLEACRAE